MWEMKGLKLRRNNMGERVLPWNSPLEIRKGGELQASVWIAAVNLEYMSDKYAWIWSGT